MPDITPVAHLSRRMAEQGRIRFGIKGDKGEPRALQTFRFTSMDRDAIHAVAKIYGGTPSIWEPGRGRSEWQVITEASEIGVFLPPDPLGDTPIYELWSGGGLVRRCDGETAAFVVATQDGSSVEERTCVCAERSEMACAVTTRLTVVLPDIRPFGGGWRLETKGWNAAHELPGMVSMIGMLQDQGLKRALLCLERRTKTSGGKTRHFMVPILKLPASAEDIIGGKAIAGASDLPEITAAPEEEAAEAEIVDDPIALLQEIGDLFTELDLPEEAGPGMRLTVTNGQVRPLTTTELGRILAGLHKIKSGDILYVGLDSRGWAKFRPADPG